VYGVFSRNQTNLSYVQNWSWVCHVSRDEKLPQVGKKKKIFYAFPPLTTNFAIEYGT